MSRSIGTTRRYARITAGQIMVACLLLLTSSDGTQARGAAVPVTSAAGAADGNLQASTLRRVNAPYFSAGLDEDRRAIFWFGVNEQGSPPTRNYADVRVGYTDQALHVEATVPDYYLWYDEDANASSDLTQYEAVAVYLDTAGDRAGTPQTDDYRFLVGLRHFEAGANYLRQARGNGSAWNASWVPTSSWSGDSAMSWYCNPGPNSNDCGIDYGWTAWFTIPWQTLGLAGRPANGTVWGLGVLLYDRDDASLTGYVVPQAWPENLSAGAPASWGELALSPPAYPPTPAVAQGTTVIRRASATDTSVVQDAWVGGGGWCGGGHEGGADENHGGLNPDGSVEETELFAGSETAVTHLPCFNKSFLRFRLDAVPDNKVILSAQLKLHHWGNSGDPNAPLEEDHPHDSYVWLYTAPDGWSETGITWNNAPLALQNMGGVLIVPLDAFADWPGIPYTWDATEAVAAAYAAGQPVSLALYDSAGGRNTTKYCTSSETGGWNLAGRPTLTVVWGEPFATIQKRAQPTNAQRGDTVTYTMNWLGVGQTVTVTDTLPVGLSTPTLIQANVGSASYDAGSRRVVWTGAPSAGQAVTLTVATTVDVDGPRALVNQATLRPADGDPTTASAAILVDPLVVLLPTVLKASR